MEALSLSALAHIIGRFTIQTLSFDGIMTLCLFKKEIGLQFYFKGFFYQTFTEVLSSSDLGHILSVFDVHTCTFG
jgi:hypothetical protein